MGQHLEGKHVDDVGVFVIDSGLQHHAVGFQFVGRDLGDVSLVVRLGGCLFVRVGVSVAGMCFGGWGVVGVLQIILAHVKLYNLSKTIW